MSKSIVKKESKVAALASVQPSDLAIREKVEALVALAAEVNDLYKSAKSDDEEMKSQMKRLVADLNGEKFTLVDWNSARKVTVSKVQPHRDNDEKGLLAALYAFYGEDPNAPHAKNKDYSKAWAAFCDVTTPIEAPRQLNDGALAKAVMDGRIPAAVAAKAKKDVPMTVKCVVSAVTKDEAKSHAAGENDEFFIAQ